ncbi:hypothetical protein T07_5289 [Trichinella nelsoni]|uniref:Uncharacterized protein n=1 Tax=Trichinella nelsoni TaxID=6336 RepID=A0A0V0SM29_9BILA|nr:hypothetical protein T07_5289 [Trichinella nelsoni]
MVSSLTIWFSEPNSSDSRYRLVVESRGNASVRKKETDMPVTSNVAALSRVRLPKLEIHQSDLFDIEKFNYLRLLLSLTAATEIGEEIQRSDRNAQSGFTGFRKRSNWASGLSDLQVRLPRGLMQKLRSTSVALGLKFNRRAEESRSSIRQATWRCQATDGFALDILCCIGFIDEDCNGSQTPIVACCKDLQKANGLLPVLASQARRSTFDWL